MRKIAIRLWFIPALALLPLVHGCTSEPSASAETHSSGSASPTVTIHPVKQNWRVEIEQPGQVEPFETTPIYANIAGFVSEVCVDMNAHVKKGDCLARLKVPEMEADLAQKTALIDQTNAERTLARKAEAAEEAGLSTARAQVTEARSHYKQTLASHEYWSLEHKRFASLVDKGVMNEQTAVEARSHVEATDAACDEAKAKIATALARVSECQVRWDKAKAEVEAAEARCHVAQCNKDHAAALLQYATLVAPYDGIVTERNVHTGHLLKLAADANRNKPLFTVVRTDRVRIFVDVPETESAYVRAGTSARVRVHALKDRDIDAVVARISWTLNPNNRTLRAEIELPNVEDQLRPGMYAFATLLVDHPIWAVPAAVIERRDDGCFCRIVQDGNAVEVPIRVGARRAAMVEVLKKGVPCADRPGECRWIDFSGEERIVQSQPAAGGH